MATINHKEEVLKVYPDAVCNHFYNDGMQSAPSLYYIKAEGKYLNEYSQLTEDLAWQNAYNTHIKNQNI